MVIFKDLTIKCGWHNCPLGRRTQYILSPVRNFYDVPSELRLYRLRYLPLFQSKCNVLERPHHPAAAEESKVSAALLRWVLRKFCRERRKASAFLQVQQNRLRLFFCFHKDVSPFDTCPFSSPNATFSKGLTILPRPKNPRSPPRFFDGSCESSAASAAKLPPFCRCNKTVFACSSVFTRMWLARTSFTMIGILKRGF